jgi:small subunit ribosomal protein S12
MTTTNQVIRGARKDKKVSIKTPILKIHGTNSPQVCGTIVKTRTLAPRKPNSAQRKAAEIKIGSKRTIVYIPDEKHTLAAHSDVLINGRKPRDLPGVNYSVMRGLKDAASSAKRRNKRSKYGVKKPTAAKA